MKLLFGIFISFVLLLLTYYFPLTHLLESRVAVQSSVTTKTIPNKNNNPTTTHTTKPTNEPINPTKKPVKTTDEAEDPITLSFTGDILLDSGVGVALDQQGVDFPYQYIKHILQDSDIAVGNLETSVSTRGKPEEKLYAFRSKPESLKGLADAGYDMVSIANNHTLDYGTDALLDTMNHLKNYGIGFSGAGKNEEEAFTAYYKTVNGKKIAILGLSRVLPYVDWAAKPASPGIASAYTYEPMMKYVKEAVDHSDYAIVFIHWNKERTDYPEDYAREMARKFIDSGVAAVMGSHSHSLMGIENYKGAPIYYSLGNFVFTQSKTLKGQESMIVNLTIQNDEVHSQIIPAKIISFQPQLMDQEYNLGIIEKLNRLSYNVQIDSYGNVTYE